MNLVSIRVISHQIEGLKYLVEMSIGCIHGRSITPPVWVITLPNRTCIQALTRFAPPVRNSPMNLFIECCQSAEVLSFDVGVHPDHTVRVLGASDRYPSLAHSHFKVLFANRTSNHKTTRYPFRAGVDMYAGGPDFSRVCTPRFEFDPLSHWSSVPCAVYHGAEMRLRLKAVA